MKIVVIGGTGLIGSKVVEKLRQKGHEVIAAAPNTGVNTITGEGLAPALAGAQVVVDVANSPSFENKAALDFFRTAGKNLIAAEAAANVRHHVALSVVGTERLQNSGYFRVVRSIANPCAVPAHIRPTKPFVPGRATCVSTGGSAAISSGAPAGRGTGRAGRPRG